MGQSAEENNFITTNNTIDIDGNRYYSASIRPDNDYNGSVF